MLVQRIQVAWRSHPELSWPTLVMQTNHVPQLPHNNQNRLSVQKLGVPHDLCYLGVLLQLRILEVTQIHRCRKVSSPFPFFRAFSMTFFSCSCLSSPTLPAFLGTVVTFCKPRPSHPKFSLLGNRLVHNLLKKNPMNCTPYQQQDLRDLWVESSQCAFSLIRGIQRQKRILISENCLVCTGSPQTSWQLCRARRTQVQLCAEHFARCP